MDYIVENGHFLLHVRASVVSFSGLCSHLICLNMKAKIKANDPNMRSLKAEGMYPHPSFTHCKRKHGGLSDYCFLPAYLSIKGIPKQCQEDCDSVTSTALGYLSLLITVIVFGEKGVIVSW